MPAPLCARTVTGRLPLLLALLVGFATVAPEQGRACARRASAVPVGTASVSAAADEAPVAVRCARVAVTPPAAPAADAPRHAEPALPAVAAEALAPVVRTDRPGRLARPPTGGTLAALRTVVLRV